MREREDVEESLGSTIRLGSLIALLSVPQIVKSKDVVDSLRGSSRCGYSEVVGAMSDSAKKEVGNMEFGKGYDAVRALNVLARTLYAEARGEGEDGMRAVASTIFNRSGRDPKKMVGVCFAEKQYSCWNDVKHGYGRSYEIVVPKSSVSSAETKRMWDLAKEIAWELLSGNFTSTIGDLNSYYNPEKASPSWRSDLKRRRKIGRHVFGYLSEQDPKTKEIRPYASTFSYTIKRGDRLEKIAHQHGMTTRELMSANNGIDPSRLRVGQQIRVPKYAD